MNLLLGRCLLLVGLLVVSTWTQEVQEKKCGDLLKSLPLDDRSVVR